MRKRAADSRADPAHRVRPPDSTTDARLIASGDLARGSGACGTGRSGSSGARRLPAGWEQGRDVAQAYALPEARQCVGQVLDRVHARELTAAEHGVRDGRALGAGVTSSE
jgi:hypothetical protein